jgi:hypothetical protein
VPRLTGRSPAPAAELALIEEAWRLFEQAPPSAEHAQAWLDYAARPGVI